MLVGGVSGLLGGGAGRVIHEHCEVPAELEEGQAELEGPEGDEDAFAPWRVQAGGF